MDEIVKTEEPTTSGSVKVDMQNQRMSAGRGKPKELRTFDHGGKTYYVLSEQPPQNWQLDRWILNETGMGVPDGENGENLVVTISDDGKTLFVKKVTMDYQVEVQGL